MQDQSISILSSFNRTYSIINDSFKQYVNFSQIPPETKIKFTINISKLQCKGLSSISNIFQLKIFLPDNKCFSGNGESSYPIFKISQTVCFEKRFDELRTSFMGIDILTLNMERKGDKKDIDDIINSNSSKLIPYSGIKIDLLSLLIGPQYYDVMLYDNYNNQNEKGRLSFKINTHQINVIEVNSKNLVIKLFKKSSIGNQIGDEIMIKTDDNLWKIKNKLDLSESIFLKKVKEDNDCIVYEPQKKIDIAFAQQLAISQLHFSNFFPFVFFSVPKNSDNFEFRGYYPVKLVELLFPIFSKIECQTAKLFNLLLINSEKLGKPEEINYLLSDSLQTKTSNDIIRNNEVIGHVSSDLSLKNIPLLKQFPCGIFTEKGLAINSYNLYSYLQCPKNSFAAFSNISSQLTSLYQSIRNKIDNEKSKPPGTINYRVNCELTEIIHLFDESISDNFLCYQYDKFEDMHRAQELFLLIGNAMYELLNNLSIEDVMSAFDIIKLVSEREEFEQSVVCESWIDYNEITNTYTFKDAVVQKGLVELLMQFNISSLRFSKFSDASPEDEENKKIPQSRLYLNILMANNFFKFPQARMSILNSLYMNIPNKNLNYIQYDKELIDLYPESKVLYWDFYLNKKLVTAIKNLKLHNEKVQQLIAIMKERKTQEVPFPELNIEHMFGFDLIKNIIQLAIKKLGKDHREINWLAISSFPEIINLIIHELSNKEISEYPSNLQEVLVLFVSDSRVINKFLNVIISKTNAYDTNAVYYVIGFIDSVLVEQKKRSPYVFDFDYGLILKAFSIIANIDNCLTISKMLWLYYKNSHLMPIFHLLEMVQQIFDAKFFIFFFHWSWKIRKMWYTLLKYILLYRLDDKIKYSDLKVTKTSTGEVESKQLFSDYFKEKMEVILKIKAKTQSKGGVFQLTEENKNIIEKHIISDNWNNIENGIKEYMETEREFNEWKAKKAKKPNVDYPVMVISALKDDIDL